MAQTTIKTIEEATTFLEKVSHLAKTGSQRDVAKTLKMSLPGFNNALIKAHILSGLSIPPFANLKADKISKIQHLAKVVASGKESTKKRLVIPQTMFEELGWKAGIKLKIQVKKKAQKLILSPVKD